MPKVGDVAPDFLGTTDENKPLRLSDLRGNVVVLYFYPRANTPGCTKEACSFRDSMVRLVGLGVKVVGVSTDPVSRQANFKAKYSLGFPLVADADKTITRKYSVLRTIGFADRVTFLLDRKGIVRFIWPKVNVTGHVDEVIAKIEELKL
jgi:peroxiredoxin Q/BCP